MAARLPNPRDRWTDVLVNPSPEHHQLEAKLYKFAAKLGYPMTRLDNPAPDVIVELDPDVYIPHPTLPKIFLGDAKVSKNEGPNNAKSSERIWLYVATFARAVRAGDIHGGVLAIITDTEARAKEWADALAEMTTDAGLTGERGGQPVFNSEKFRSAWVVWWKVGRWRRGARLVRLPTGTKFGRRRPGR